MAIKFPDSDGEGNPGTPELSFENHIAIEFSTDSATFTNYGDAAHLAYTQTKRPHRLSDYFVEGGEVPDADANYKIPNISSFPAAISFSDFYGAVNEIKVEFTSNQYTIKGVTYTAAKGTTLNLYNIASLATNPNASGVITVPFIFEFDANTVFNNSVILGGEFKDLTIDNSGIIAGRGGHGATLTSTSATKTNIGSGVTIYTGNTALLLDDNVSKLEIINQSGGLIAGGGNGGSLNTAYSAYNPSGNYGALTFGDETIYADAFGRGGGGGGWNGGRGGRGFADGRAYARDESDDNTWGSQSYSYASPEDTGGSSSFVTSRSSSGSSGGGGGVGYVSRVANRTLGVTGGHGASGGGGGTGLNGGTQGTGSAAGAYTFSGTPAAQVKSSAGGGGGGGSGVGSLSGIVNSNGLGGTNAGGGRAIEIASGVTITTKTFTNSGHRYGTTAV